MTDVRPEVLDVDLSQQPKRRGGTGRVPQRKLDLRDFERFSRHPWVTALDQVIQRDFALADSALRTVMSDLRTLNEAYADLKGRYALVAVDGRVKEKSSLLRKLHSACLKLAHSGITQDIIEHQYQNITDICGVRFSCPYYDEVLPTANDIVRPRLAELGYAIEIPELADKDYLDNGDENGYRSYHFFVKVPTPVDIYGGSELCVCEVQARTELQHVWAVKSHNLLYKEGAGWIHTDQHVREDMKQLSNSLRAADQMLVSVRDRVRGGGNTDV